MAGAEPSPQPPPPRRRSRRPIPLLRRIVATAVVISCYYGGSWQSSSVVLALSSPSPSHDTAQVSSPSADVDGRTKDGTTIKRMVRRIAVVGAGAVGSYYGGRLWEGARRAEEGSSSSMTAQCADTSVLFHLRGENYDICTKRGIEISSYHGDFHIPSHELSAYRTTEEMARAIVSVDAKCGGGGTPGDDDGEYFDWIVCALKSTAVSNFFRYGRFFLQTFVRRPSPHFSPIPSFFIAQLDEVPILIEPLLSPETRLLVIMNGLIEDDLVNMMRQRRVSMGLDGVGCRAIYGGMALICSNRTSPGKISHTYGGKLVCGVAYSGDYESGVVAGGDGSGYDGWVDTDKRAIEDLFRHASPIPFEFDPNLRRGR